MRYIIKKLKKLPDPRPPWKVQHPLCEIIAISIIAILCGATSSTQIYQFAILREKWLRKFLPLEHGIPHRLTIERMFRILNPRVFEEWFRIIMQKVQKDTKGAVVSLDGKQFFSQQDTDGNKKNPLYIVSAWCQKNGVTLAHQKSMAKPMKSQQYLPCFDP